MNYTLTVDLSQSWTPGNAPVNALAEEAPTSVMGLLWVDSEDSVYSLGGRQSSLVSESTSTNPGTQLWKFSGSSWSNILDSPSTASPTLTGISPAQGAAAFGNSVGYALGGYTKDASHDALLFTGLLSYNSTSNTWSNDSTAPAVTPYGFVGNQMIFVPVYGMDGILIAVGGQYAGPGTFPASGLEDVPLSNVSVYDIATKTWFWQTATGLTRTEDIPQGRNTFCAAGMKSAQGTYEIFVYGGFLNEDAVATTSQTSNNSDSQTDANLVYILSLPGFVWLRVNDTSAEPRAEHTCNAIGNRQVLSIGGRNPMLGFNDAFNTKDSWPQGLGIFDMTDLKWTGSYNASSTPYNLSTPMQDWYNGP